MSDIEDAALDTSLIYFDDNEIEVVQFEGLYLRSFVVFDKNLKASREVFILLSVPLKDLCTDC